MPSVNFYLVPVVGKASFSKENAGYKTSTLQRMKYSGNSEANCLLTWVVYGQKGHQNRTVTDFQTLSNLKRKKGHFGWRKESEQRHKSRKSKICATNTIGLVTMRLFSPNITKYRDQPCSQVQMLHNHSVSRDSSNCYQSLLPGTTNQAACLECQDDDC